MIPSDPSGFRLVYYPAPILKKRAVEIERFTPQVHALAKRMFEVMRENKGVGLAAPQVGVGVRLFVCNVTGEPGDDLVFVNPHFTDLNDSEENEEGCLSIPGVTVTMRRATRAVIEAFDGNGKRFRVTGQDTSARVWQHEMDHINGRLIIDNMSATDEIVNRRAVKQLKQEYASVR